MKPLCLEVGFDSLYQFLLMVGVATCFFQVSSESMNFLSILPLENCPAVMHTRERAETQNDRVPSRTASVIENCRVISRQKYLAPSDAHEWASRARGESRVVEQCGPLASGGEWGRVA
jgi:hypothetical protein